MLLVALTLSACGKPQPAAPTSQSAPASATTAEPTLLTTTEIKRVDASGFTLGEYLPPLDGGKIEIAVPEGWKPAPRDSKYVVRFSSLAAGGGLPRIDVIVEEDNLGGLADLSEENIVEFASAIAQHLDEAGTAVIEPPLPMIIGSVPCARYVSNLKLNVGGGTIVVERQTLALLHAGRLYKINLSVEVSKLIDSRDAAYAICSAIRFPADE
jgi:hypothetical protein